VKRLGKVADGSWAGEAVSSKPITTSGDQRRINRLIPRYWAEALVVAIAVVVWAPRLTGPIDLRWDGGVYYILGTSLATGHGYRILSEPGSPEAVQYPPLLPAVVAMHAWVLGTTDPGAVAPWLRKLYFLTFVAYALAVLALAKRYLPPWLGLAAAALSLLQVESIFFSDALFTELPFALVSIVFVLVAVGGPFASRPWLRETVSFGLAVIGFLLRTAGLVLLAAWVLEALAQRRWRLLLARGAVSLLPVLAWQAHVARVQVSYEYTHPAYEYQRAPYQFYNVSYAENAVLLDPLRPELGHVDAGGLARRITANLSNMMLALGGAISTRYHFWQSALLQLEETLHWLHRSRNHAPIFPPDVVCVPMIGLSALAIAGVGILAYRRAWLMVFIILTSIGLICTFSWTDQIPRYLMPLAPFLAIAAMLALFQLHAVLRACRLHPTTITLGQVALTGVLVLPLVVQIYVAWAVFNFYQRGREGATFVPGAGPVGHHFFFHDWTTQDWEQAVSWLGSHAVRGEIVATIAPHQLYLQTGLRAVCPPMDVDPAGERRLLEAVPVSYVIIDEFPYRDFSRRYALPAVEGDGAGWHLVYSINDTRIYERANRPE
jgi:hypothetical protein